jgi:hypothetical protein
MSSGSFHPAVNWADQTGHAGSAQLSAAIIFQQSRCTNGMNVLHGGHAFFSLEYMCDLRLCHEVASFNIERN